MKLAVERMIIVDDANICIIVKDNCYSYGAKKFNSDREKSTLSIG